MIKLFPGRFTWAFARLRKMARAWLPVLGARLGALLCAAGLAVFAGCGTPTNLQLAPHDLTLHCPDGMVLIEAASFYSGPYHTPGAQLFAAAPTQRQNGGANASTSPSTGAQPPTDPNQATTIQVPAFCIDRYPRARTAASSPGGAPAALGAVAFDPARAICHRLGLHLCSPYQWELACRGKSLDRFPYGRRYDPTVCSPNAAAVAGGNPEQCVSSYGVYDQVGGQPEWVLGTQDLWSAGEVDGTTMGGLFAGENPADVDCLAQRSGPPKPAPKSAPKPGQVAARRAPNATSAAIPTMFQAPTPSASAAPDLVPAPDGLSASGEGADGNPSNGADANSNVMARVRCCGDPTGQSQYILDYER